MSSEKALARSAAWLDSLSPGCAISLPLKSMRLEEASASFPAETVTERSASRSAVI